MMTSLFALRLAPHGIAVNEIRPGLIRTDMTADVRDSYARQITDGLTPIARWGESEDVGRAVATLASGAFPFTTGEAIHCRRRPAYRAAVRFETAVDWICSPRPSRRRFAVSSG